MYSTLSNFISAALPIAAGTNTRQTAAHRAFLEVARIRRLLDFPGGSFVGNHSSTLSRCTESGRLDLLYQASLSHALRQVAFRQKKHKSLGNEETVHVGTMRDFSGLR